MNRAFILALLCGASNFFHPVFAQEVIRADGPGDTYALIHSRGMKAETPDCKHAVPHMVEVYDAELKENVFEFSVHKTPDNDRCRGTDRQRTELTVSDNFAPPYLAGHDGDTWTYGWKFRLGENFKGNTRFFHIHQIKAYQGGDDGAPIVTLTARAGGDKLELAGSIGTKTSAPLSAFRGVWVQVTETVSYVGNGPYSMVIKRVSDGQTILQWSGSVNMARKNVGYYRPKIGLYRGISDAIQDETARFADFTIGKGSAPGPEHKDPPAAPPKDFAAAAAGGQVKLTWMDTIFNNADTRIEASTDLVHWTLADTVIPRWEDDFVKVKWLYERSVPLKENTTNYFRLRCENLYGMSDATYALKIGPGGGNGQIVTVAPRGVAGDALRVRAEGDGMTVEYRLASERFVSLALYDVSGALVRTLATGAQGPGPHAVHWDGRGAQGRSMRSQVLFLRFNGDTRTVLAP